MKRRGRQRLRFLALLHEHETFIRSLAKRTAGDDADLYEDLVQEALFALWRLDPDVIAEAPDPQRAERGLIRNAMRDYRRSIGWHGMAVERL